MEMWQRSESLNTSYYFFVLGKVTRNKARLITPETMSTSPLAMSSGFFISRWKITVVMCFFEFWIEGTEGQVIGVEVGFR
jgi:hypothetical protein